MSARLARQRYARLGLRAAIATLLTTCVPGFTHKLEQVVGRPTLTQLQRSGSFTSSCREFMREAVDLDEQSWDQAESEFEQIERELADRRRQLSLAYPDNFGVERETSLLLYGSTRLLNPRLIVETGVADGVSTFVFLAALKRNGTGELHSVDVSPDVGVLVEESPQWHLHIYDADSVDDELSALLRREAPVDLFFHDSDHKFLAQLFEYETFMANASPHALLISDDVDVSYAFDTFCRRYEMRPNYLFDASRKTIGMVRL